MRTRTFTVLAVTLAVLALSFVAYLATMSTPSRISEPEASPVTTSDDPICAVPAATDHVVQSSGTSPQPPPDVARELAELAKTIARKKAMRRCFVQIPQHPSPCLVIDATVSKGEVPDLEAFALAVRAHRAGRKVGIVASPYSGTRVLDMAEMLADAKVPFIIIIDKKLDTFEYQDPPVGRDVADKAIRAWPTPSNGFTLDEWLKYNHRVVQATLDVVKTVEPAPKKKDDKSSLRRRPADFRTSREVKAALDALEKWTREQQQKRGK